jgi:hypothetical protein
MRAAGAGGCSGVVPIPAVHLRPLLCPRVPMPPPAAGAELRPLPARLRRRAQVRARHFCLCVCVRAHARPAVLTQDVSGYWKTDKSFKLETKEGEYPLWQGQALIHSGFSLEYKYIIVRNDEVRWHGIRKSHTHAHTHILIGRSRADASSSFAASCYPGVIALNCISTIVKLHHHYDHSRKVTSRLSS